jgi:ribosomal protein S12 methylthiotransferase accessory factor
MLWAEPVESAAAAGTPKRFEQGTHRTLDPTATLERILPKLRAFGITRVADITGLDILGIPVMSVMRPNARSLAVSQGKATDAPAARVSGIMESIELHHAEHIERPLRYARFSELSARAKVIDPWQLPRPAGSVFRDDLPMLWIDGWDFVEAERVWVPFEAVSVDATYPEPPGSGSFTVTSNGIASGNTISEALSHALCELIERDATTIWHARTEAGRESRAVDPATVDDPQCCAVLGQLEAAGVLVAIDDLTSDIGAPTFMCTIAVDASDEQSVALTSAGMGTHTARGVALSRALTEAAQSRLTLISGSRDDVFRDEYLATPQKAAMHRAIIGQIRSGRFGRRFGDVPDIATDDVGLDNHVLIERLTAAGASRVVLVDLRDERWGECVVRAIVPGLEGSDKVGEYVAGPRVFDAQQR